MCNIGSGDGLCSGVGLSVLINHFIFPWLPGDDDGELIRLEILCLHHHIRWRRKCSYRKSHEESHKRKYYFFNSFIDDQVCLISEYNTRDGSSIGNVIHRHLQCRGKVSNHHCLLRIESECRDVLLSHQTLDHWQWIHLLHHSGHSIPYPQLHWQYRWGWQWWQDRLIMIPSSDDGKEDLNTYSCLSAILNSKSTHRLTSWHTSFPTSCWLQREGRGDREREREIFNGSQKTPEE